MIIYTMSGQARHYAVAGGFVEVRSGNEVVVLSDATERAEEIDEARAEEAMKRAKQLMEGVRRDEVKFAEAAAALERSLMRLRVARKRRHGQTPTLNTGRN